MKIKRICIALIAVGALSIATQSSAAFELIESKAENLKNQEVQVAPVPKKVPVVVKKSKTLLNQSEVEERYRYLSFEGVPPKYMSEWTSSGANIKLSNASQIFLEKGWVFLKNGINNPKVSWKKSDYWLESLNSIARQSGYYFNINWDSKTVSASEYPKSYIYTLRKGQDLSSELARWASLSDWVLIWNLEFDYTIESNTEFKGSFDEAIIKAVKAYQSNGAMLSVTPRISKYNNTVKIEEFKEYN